MSDTKFEIFAAKRGWYIVPDENKDAEEYFVQLGADWNDKDKGWLFRKKDLETFEDLVGLLNDPEAVSEYKSLKDDPKEKVEEGKTKPESEPESEISVPRYEKQNTPPYTVEDVEETKYRSRESQRGRKSQYRSRPSRPYSRPVQKGKSQMLARKPKEVPYGEHKPDPPKRAEKDLGEDLDGYVSLRKFDEYRRVNDRRLHVLYQKFLKMEAELNSEEDPHEEDRRRE